MANIPVYIFLGFLDSGKTKFIHETLCDRNFQDNERTLVILCEEGEEELDTSKYSGGKNVTVVTVESKEQLTRKFLEDSQKKSRAERVMIEYNGMWLMQELGMVFPRNWQVYQVLMMADSNTFETYNSNMRQLVFDKINITEMIAFNRCKPDVDKMALHKIVRSIGRRVAIIYEYEDGTVENDDIVDPLPYDLNEPVVEIADDDFGLLYMDCMENPKNYDGKTLKFKILAAKGTKMPKNSFVGGRFAMTCCAEDMQYVGFMFRWDNADEIKNKSWYTVTAEVKAVRDKMFDGELGPIFFVSNVQPTIKPIEETVMFS